LLVFLLLVVLGNNSIARDSRLGGLSVQANSVEHKNAKVIQPGDDLIAAYDWLKSSDRDGQMGALSATNPRYLILTPGYYAIPEQWVIDTSYLYVQALSGSKYDTVVHRTGMSNGEYTAKIKPCHLILSGFTISYGFDNTTTGAVELEAGSYSNVCRAYGLTNYVEGTDLIPTEYSWAEYDHWLAYIGYQSAASGEWTTVNSAIGDDSTSSKVYLTAVTGGANADVASFADGGGGTVLVTTGAAHGLSDNWKASIGGSVYYDGSYVVDYVDATSFKITKAWSGAGTATGNILSIVGEVGLGDRPVVVTTSAAHGMLADGDTWVTQAGTTFYDGTYLITAVTSNTYTYTASGFFETQTGTWTRKIGSAWENCVFGLIFNDFKYYDMHFYALSSSNSDSSFFGEYWMVGRFERCDGTYGFATFSIEADRPAAKTYCVDCVALGFGSFGGDNQYQGVAALYTSGIDWSTYIRCDAGNGGFAGCGGWGSHFGGYIEDCTGGFGCVALNRTMFGTVINSHFGDMCIGGVPDGLGISTLRSKITGYVDNVTVGQASLGMSHADSVVTGTVKNSRMYSSGLGNKSESWRNVVAGVAANEKLGVSYTDVVSSFTGIAANNHTLAPTNITASSYTVSAFDNGQTFTNLGAGASVEFTLPAAIAGRHYTFVRAEAADTKDVLLTPAGSDTIDGGADLDNTADEIAKCKLECLVTGNWVSTSTGTWN